MNEVYSDLIETVSQENGEIMQTMSGKKMSEPLSSAANGRICYSLDGIYPNTGMYEWSVKCEGMHLNDMIGIISSLEKIKEVEYILSCPGIKYHWWTVYGIWENDKHFSADWNDRNHELFDRWSDGDMITIQLDTHENTLTFIKNGKKRFKPINLPNSEEQNEEIVWYPFVQTSTIKSKYTHIV